MADSVDTVLRDWATTRPDLDVTPIGIVLRLGRLRARMEERMETVLAGHGLTLADFSAVAAIARLEGDDGVSQVRLMRQLDLTSGTISVRIDRLTEAGLATREPDPADRRGALVRLTLAGRRTFEAAAADHLANERAMLAGLDDVEQHQLAALLRALLTDLERDDA